MVAGSKLGATEQASKLLADALIDAHCLGGVIFASIITRTICQPYTHAASAVALLKLAYTARDVEMEIR